MLCFRCRWGRDFESDKVAEEAFQGRKRLYEEQYAEWQSLCAKQQSWWQSRCETKYAEWESQQGARWLVQQKIINIITRSVNGITCIAFIALACLITSYTDKWDNGERLAAVLIGAAVGATLLRNSTTYILSAASYKHDLAGPLKKEFPPPALTPPTLPQSKTPALCGHPQLLFDGNKQADLTPSLVYYYPLELFADSKRRNPPDWKERKNKCKQRDQSRCALCGKTRILAAHHVIPKYERGSHSLQNLITLCDRCHYEQKYYDHEKKLKRSYGMHIDDDGHSRIIVKYAPQKRAKSPDVASNNQLEFNFGEGDKSSRNFGELE